MQIDTRFEPLRVTNSVDVTTGSAIVEPVPTTVMPNGDGVISMGMSGGGKSVVTAGAMLANSVKLVPYGITDEATFTMNVYGWELTSPGYISGSGLWVPVLLASFTVTLGSQVGVANSDVAATEFFADTIVLIVGNANVSVEIVSPGATTQGEIAHIILDAKGCALLEVRFGLGGSATAANCLAKRL